MNLNNYMQKIMMVGNLGVTAIATIWGVALVLALGTVNSVKTALMHYEDAEIVAAMPLPTLHKGLTAMTPEDYRQRVEMLNVPATIMVESSKDGIIVRARSLSDFDAWMRVTREVMVAGKSNEEWDFKNLCTGECPESAYMALMTGTRRNYMVN